MPDHLLIRGARIIDGTGAPCFVSDLRIQGGHIADIGANLSADGAELADADGRVPDLRPRACPGLESAGLGPL